MSSDNSLPTTINAERRVSIRMDATEQDVERAQRVMKMTAAPTAAAAVSRALALAEYLLRENADGADILLQYQDGAVARVVMEGVLR